MTRHTVTLPKLGDTAEDVVVLEWNVEVGGTVAQGDPLLSVETSKVTADVPSPVAGTLVERLVEVDEEVEVGTELCVIEVAG